MRVPPLAFLRNKMCNIYIHIEHNGNSIDILAISIASYRAFSDKIYKSMLKNAIKLYKK